MCKVSDLFLNQFPTMDVLLIVCVASPHELTLNCLELLRGLQVPQEAEKVLVFALPGRVVTSHDESARQGLACLPALGLHKLDGLGKDCALHVAVLLPVGVHHPEPLQVSESDSAGDM